MKLIHSYQHKSVNSTQFQKEHCQDSNICPFFIMPLSFSDSLFLFTSPYHLQFVNIRSVSAISFSINGRILSLYFDKSASLKLDNIPGIYCGFARPTCARTLTHCLAVIGFSSVICERKSDIIASNRFPSSHWAFAARMYNARFLTNDLG